VINNNVATRAGNIVNNQNSHEIERSGVEFASCGTILKGVLIEPKGTTKPLPCVIMAPGMAGVKEGSILKYAEYFARGALLSLPMTTSTLANQAENQGKKRIRNSSAADIGTRLHLQA
jgi:dienelactone hydrolase